LPEKPRASYTPEQATGMNIVPAIEPDKKSRKASKETRQQQLIDATIDSLAKRGYADTTLANVADGAKLSRGIVNFHFESKEKLLIATLQYMSDEYSGHWNNALEKAQPSAAGRMWALVNADFDRRICTRRKLAAWCAFWGEAKSRPTYQALCGASDLNYQKTFVELCTAMKAEADYAFDPEPMALGICSMMEGLWFRLMMNDGLSREKALDAAIEYVAAVFPRHISTKGLVKR
jgi:TetR/AcrR family transcriptional repressor of bet genes